MRYLGVVLWNLPEIIGGTLVFVIMVIIGAAVTSRYLFFFAFTWAEELVRFLFIWLSFIGGALAVKHITHFRLVLVRNALPPAIGRALDVFAHLSFALFGAILLVVGFEIVTLTMEQLSPALYIPQGVVYAAMPVSGAMMIFYSGLHAFRILTGREETGVQAPEI